MAFNTTTLGLYHTFSKTPVDQNQGSAAAQLGNAINKSGHTVQSSEVWAEAIPFYGKAGKTELAHKNLSATANKNDLVQVGSVLYQRNSTPAQFDASGALTSTFADLWFEKTTSIISTTKGEDGTYPTAPGALVDGSYLVNAEGKPVIRYYKDRLLTPLIDDNNANTHSQGWASRLKVDGRWVEQFVGATDAYVNGNAAVMYSPVIYRKKGDAKPLDAGAGKHYMDYCATGIILWDSQKTSITTNSAGEFTGATEVISCFEYVGKKLNASLASIVTDIEAINLELGHGGTGTTGGIGERLTAVEGEVSTLKTTTQTQGGKITNIEEALETLNGTDSETGSIAHSIKTAIDNLGDVAVKGDITITEIKVKSGSTTTTLTPDSKKSVTVEIPEVQAATTDVAGVVTISDNDAIATTETSTAAAATVAAVAATRSAIAGELGALAETVSSNKTEVDGKITAIEGKLASTGEIGQAIADVKATADSAVQSVTRASSSSTLLTVTDGTNATISLSAEVATKTDAANAASTAITTSLNGTATGTIGAAVADAKKAGTDAQTSVNTLSSTSLTYSTTAGNVTLKLGGTVSSPSIQFAGVASTTALTALETKVDNFHKAGVSYKVLDTLPDPGVAYNGVIVLVPSILGIEETTDEKEAITGSYVEWLCVNKGTEEAPQWAWEQIGTTEADLHGYVNNIHSSQAGTLANQGSVYAGISSTGYLSIGVASATDSVMGVSKMFTGNLSTAASTATDTAVSVKSAQAMYGSLASAVSGKVSSVGGGSYLELAGIVVSQNGDSVGVSAKPIANDSSAQIDYRWETIKDGIVNGEINIDTTKIAFTTSDASKSFVQDNSVLTTWSGDMPNLKCGGYMFDSCSALTSFCGDLSNLTDGGYMFRGCSALTSFCGDLSNLTEGSHMFGMCKLDAESLECIAETLPTVTGSHAIVIGYGSLSTAAEAGAAKAAIEAKGWTCIMEYNA